MTRKVCRCYCCCYTAAAAIATVGCCFYYNDVVEDDRGRERKKVSTRCPLSGENRRREKVRDLVLHPGATIVTTRTDVPEQGAGVPRTLLLSGVLHNSLSVFLRCCNPSSYGDPLGSFSPPSNGGAAATPSQQWDSSGIENKLCSAMSARKMTKP